MKTTNRIAATLLFTTALASCATETDDEDDSPAETVTTDTSDEDDASED